MNIDDSTNVRDVVVFTSDESSHEWVSVSALLSTQNQLKRREYKMPNTFKWRVLKTVFPHSEFNYYLFAMNGIFREIATALQFSKINANWIRTFDLNWNHHICIIFRTQQLNDPEYNKCYSAHGWSSNIDTSNTIRHTTSFKLCKFRTIQNGIVEQQQQRWKKQKC